MAERRDTRHGEVRESVPPLPFVEHAAALIEALGLHRVGREWHGPCPACGGTDSFWIADYGGRLSVNCRQCRGLEPLRALVANGLLPRPGRGPDARLHDRGSEEPSRPVGLTETMTGTPSEVIIEAHRSRRERRIDDAGSSGDAVARRMDGHRVPPGRDGRRRIIRRRGSRGGGTRCVRVACHAPREAMNAACRRMRRSAASFYRDIAEGSLPPPLKIGRSARWSEIEIDALVEAAIARRDQESNAGP